MKTTMFTSAIVAVAFVLPACKANLGDDETNIAADYEETQYKESIVTGRKRKKYEDQGKGVSPNVIANIDHTIRNVYERDFERCLEDEMDRLETRFLRSVYTVEFHIDTQGKVTAAKILELKGTRQDAKGSHLGEFETNELSECIQTAVLAWEFDDKPEVDFKHTYRGQAGEAY